MNDREKAHRELTHALRALHETTGTASQGPSAIARTLLGQDGWAGIALCYACLTLEGLGVISKDVGLPALEKLAPVLLDISLDAAEVCAPEAAIVWRRTIVARLVDWGRV